MMISLWLHYQFSRMLGRRLLADFPHQDFRTDYDLFQVCVVQGKNKHTVVVPSSGNFTDIKNGVKVSAACTKTNFCFIRIRLFVCMYVLGTSIRSVIHYSRRQSSMQAGRLCLLYCTSKTKFTFHNDIKCSREGAQVHIHN
jgi:hypothetical protein